jgi:hypothetical protein
MRRFLITGCPRSGTKYTAMLFRRALGARVGHEQVFGVVEGLREGPVDWDGLDGDASWLAVPFLPLDDTIVLHQVRHPLEFVRSVCGFGLLSDERADLPFPQVLRLHAPEVYVPDTEAERGATLWRIWNAKAEAHATITYRLEDLDLELLLRLGRLIEPDVSEEQAAQALESLPKTVNQRRRDESVEWETIQHIAGDAAVHYGY